MPVATDGLQYARGWALRLQRGPLRRQRRDGPVDMVLSIGWAGALRDEGHPGELHIPNIVVNAQTGERFVLAEREKPDVLVTTDAGGE